MAGLCYCHNNSIEWGLFVMPARKKRQDVVKSNAYVDASYHPATIRQHRLLTAGLLTLRGKERLKPDQRIEVSVADLEKLTGQKQDYARLRLALQELWEFELVLPDYRPNGDPGAPRKRRLRAIHTADEMHGEGKVAFVMARGIIPYVSGNTSHFTIQQAKCLMHMKSVYGVRLYELLLMEYGRRHQPGRPDVFIDWDLNRFRELFALGDKHTRIDAFLRVVVRPAIDDVEKHTALTVRNWKWRRGKGRFIEGVQFCVEMKKPVRAAPSPTTGDRILIGWNTLTPGELSEFGKVGETGEAAKSRWNVMSPDSRRAWRAERAKRFAGKN